QPDKSRAFRDGPHTGIPYEKGSARKPYLENRTEAPSGCAFRLRESEPKAQRQQSEPAKSFAKPAWCFQPFQPKIDIHLRRFLTAQTISPRNQCDRLRL